jgi:hypothetical protein
MGPIGELYRRVQTLAIRSGGAIPRSTSASARAEFMAVKGAHLSAG